MIEPSTPPAPPTGPRTSTMAIVSLIAGILGIVQVLPLIGPIAAIITGHIAKNEIKTGGGTLAGDGMATAGLVLGYVTLALGVCVACLFALMFAGLITIPFFSFPNYNTSF